MRRCGPPVEALYSAFPENRKLCPVQTLLAYERKMQGMRSTSEQGRDSNPLFISVHNHFKPATLGKWLKSVMKGAGTDTDTFSAHSTRGVATSKAKVVGVSLADILKAANWTSAATFSRVYNRQIISGQFGQSVLRARPHYLS